MKKLKDILIEAFEDDRQSLDKHEVIESVSQYGRIGKQLYSSTNVLKIADQLTAIAEAAHEHILSEEGDWFDKISISRNMKSLKGTAKEFTKAAREYNTLGQRLTSLHEEMGSILNRYYDIQSESEEQDKYQTFFRKTAKKFGFNPDEIDELPDEKKRKFFNYIDKNYSAEKESD